VPSLRRILLALATTLVLLATAPLLPAGAQEGQPPQEEADTRSTDQALANTVTAYGDAVDHGPARSLDLVEPFESIAPTPDGGGYWIAASDGGVFSYGNATFAGSAGDIELVQPIVGIAAHPDAGGYWLVAADGGVFSYGTAAFHGSMGGTVLNQPIVGMAAHADGDGYWLLAADGGIFSFGGAEFHGSAGDIALNQPIVGMAAHPDGEGYWFVAADGGVFSHGSAVFHGSMGGKDADSPVVGMAASDEGDGYWLASAAGEVFGFGVIERGSATEAGAGEPHARTVGITALPVGDGYWLVHGALPVLEVQDSGPAVEALQRRLQELGYWVGPIDGIYGSPTEQAVYAFEKYEGLPIDGAADSDTRRALQTASRPVPRTTSGSMIEIDKSRQILFFVAGGRTQWVFNTSTGTEEPYTFEGERYIADTPPGRWEMFRQVDGVRVSNLGRLIRPKYFHRDGIAIHGYSFVPPYPASHGCVRVTLPAIDFIWANDLAPIGSQVWVYGETPG
jgi:hypothetical protein